MAAIALSSPSTSASTKRKRTESAIPALCERPSKRPRPSGTSSAVNKELEENLPPKLTAHELQTLGYLNEIISHGIRSYATGWLLEDTTMSLWYIDRIGVVQATRFDIFQDPQYLLLVVAAMLSAPLWDMGLCHLLTANTGPDKQFKTWDGMTLRLDEAETDTGTLSGLRFELVDVQRMRTNHGAVGRGTTLIPIRPTDDTATLLHVENCQTLIAKIAWPTANRTSESDFVKKIRRCLMESGYVNTIKHIVDIKCSLSHTMEQARLPRAFMDLEETPRFEERVFRCFVMTKYKPLEMVNNVDEFKKVFLDAVRGTLSFDSYAMSRKPMKHS